MSEKVGKGKFGTDKRDKRHKKRWYEIENWKNCVFWDGIIRNISVWDGIIRNIQSSKVSCTFMLFSTGVDVADSIRVGCCIGCMRYRRGDAGYYYPHRYT